MTAFRILSDLHLEGQPFVYEPLDEDVLILAGDIHTRNRLHEFLATLPQDLLVLFVMGNHEAYHGIFEDVVRYHKGLEDQFNFKFLNNSYTEVDDIPIYGGTMFTDFQLYGPGEAWFCEHRAKDGINDFECIKTLGQHYEPRRWRTSDHTREHEHWKSRFDLFMRLSEGAEKRIVISHFMPTDQCTPERFRGHGLNPYFTANMEPYMGWDGLWICGHGHDPADFDVNGTRVVMNPRGYGPAHRPENPKFNPNLIIEI